MLHSRWLRIAVAAFGSFFLAITLAQADAPTSTAAVQPNESIQQAPASGKTAEQERECGYFPLAGSRIKKRVCSLQAELPVHGRPIYAPLDITDPRVNNIQGGLAAGN